MPILRDRCRVRAARTHQIKGSWRLVTSLAVTLTVFLTGMIWDCGEADGKIQNCLLAQKLFYCLWIRWQSNLLLVLWSESHLAETIEGFGQIDSFFNLQNGKETTHAVKCKSASTISDANPVSKSDTGTECTADWFIIYNALTGRFHGNSDKTSVVRTGYYRV